MFDTLPVGAVAVQACRRQSRPLLSSLRSPYGRPGHGGTPVVGARVHLAVARGGLLRTGRVRIPPPDTAGPGDPEDAVPARGVLPGPAPVHPQRRPAGPDPGAMAAVGR